MTMDNQRLSLATIFMTHCVAWRCSYAIPRALECIKPRRKFASFDVPFGSSRSIGGQGSNFNWHWTVEIDDDRRTVYRVRYRNPGSIWTLGLSWSGRCNIAIPSNEIECLVGITVTSYFLVCRCLMLFLTILFLINFILHRYIHCFCRCKQYW